MSALKFLTRITRRRYGRTAWHMPDYLQCSCISTYTGHLSIDIFDRSAKQQQRDYAAELPDSSLYDYLKEEIGWRVADRVFDIKRQFDTVLDLGCSKGHVFKHFDNEMVGHVLACELSASALSVAAAVVPAGVRLTALHEDEETLQLPENSVDLVTSSLSLHWVNDLPGCFARVHQCLRPDCAFVGALLGGDTLYQLRCALQLASLERRGGVGVHVSPQIQPTDLAGLLSRAGFTLLTLDTDAVTVRYPSALELLWDLRGMAEGGAARSRRLNVGRDTLMAAAAVYREMYGGGDETESVPATFQVLNFIAWKPGAGQPEPLQRGSAGASLKDIGKVVSGV